MVDPKAGADNTGWWRATSLTLAAVVVSLATAWFSFGKDSVTQAQVRNLIQQTSPYALDRAGIKEKLANEQAQLQEIKAAVRAAQSQEAREERQLARMDAQLQRLVIQHGG